MKTEGISFFEKNLTIWVLLCMAFGVTLGQLFPQFSQWLGQLELYNVSIPATILLWIMIYPMLLKIDFSSLKNIGNNPKGLFLTWSINWLVKPFTMYAIGYVFFFIIYQSILPSDLALEYLIGAVLLGAAPCTAMVFVWSKLTKGDSAYTLVQVASNDLIILVAFVPIVSFLLNRGDIYIPWETLVTSVVLFVVVPLIFSVITRRIIIQKYGEAFLTNQFIPKFDPYTMIGLLLTLVMIFTFQGNKILAQPLDIVLIAFPLIVQVFFIFGVTFSIAYFLKLPYSMAAPCSMIGASNFFELSVAVAIALFGLSSGATLATVVGVLVEVPVMLLLVKVANNLAYKFTKNI